MMMDHPDDFRSILKTQDEAWSAGDATAFSDVASADIVFTNVVGLFSIGRAAFEAQHRHIFSTFYRGSTLRQHVEHIRFLKPDVAIVNTLTEVRGFGRLPPIFAVQEGVLRTRLEQVLLRTDEVWRVEAFHNVVLHPQANAAAPSPAAGVVVDGGQ